MFTSENIKLLLEVILAVLFAKIFLNSLERRMLKIGTIITNAFYKSQVEFQQQMVDKMIVSMYSVSKDVPIDELLEKVKKAKEDNEV